MQNVSPGKAQGAQSEEAHTLFQEAKAAAGRGARMTATLEILERRAAQAKAKRQAYPFAARIGVGFDIERHRYPAYEQREADGTKVGGIDFNGYGTPGYKPVAFNGTAEQRFRNSRGERIGWQEYPVQLVIQDVLTLHGRQFRDAALIGSSREPVKCKRQAGFISWAALAILLALVLIVGQVLADGVGVFLKEQVGKSRPMLILEDIRIRQPAEEYPVKELVPVWHFDMSNLERLSIVRGKDILDSRYAYGVFLPPCIMFWLVQKLADQYSQGEFIFRAKPPFHFPADSSRAAKVLHSHSPRSLEHALAGSVRSLPFINALFRDPKEWPGNKVGAFLFLNRGFLLAGNIGKFVSGSHQQPGDNNQKTSGSGSQEVRIKKNFSDLDDDEQVSAIRGALLLAGIFILLAYIVTGRDK